MTNRKKSQRNQPLERDASIMSFSITESAVRRG
jgi:hypothetical protein